MKTLDEVIEALEYYGDFVGECNYCDAKYCNKSYEMKDCFAGDALHYLKDYRESLIKRTIVPRHLKEME